MFIQPDDYLIVMDMNFDGVVDLTADEMLMLRDVGVKTLYYQAAIRWDVMQPHSQAALDWRIPDTFVENARRAGLKMLVPFVYALPAWLPDEWFYNRQCVMPAYGVPNYLNPEVGERLDSFMLEIIDRYRGDDFQLVYSIPGNGEFVVDLWPADNRLPFPVDKLIEWVLARQAILEAQHGEVWTAYHPYTNPDYWHPLYNALFDAFPTSKHYGIIFTYVQHGMRHFKQLLQDNKDRGMTYYGGTEYIQGMRRFVPHLRGDGVRMLTAPKHPYQEYRRIEPFMLGEIRWAIGEYKNA